MTRLLRVAAILAFAGWFVALRPQVLGGPASWILVAGESMEPNIHAGSLVIVVSRPAYDVGDVVAYRVPEGNPGAGDNVIHRITGGTADTGYVVRGDNASGPDMWRPRRSDVVGAAWLVVSDAVPVLLFLRSPILVASVAAGLASYIVLGFLAPPHQNQGDRRERASGYGSRRPGMRRRSSHRRTTGNQAAPPTI
jgi:signal peptidase I